MSQSQVAFEILEDSDALKRVETPWQELVAKSPSATVFHTFEWSQCWWDTVGRHRTGVQPRIVRLFSGASTVGILPLMRVTERGGTVLRFLSAPVADFHDLIADVRLQPEHLGGLFHWLFDELDDADGVELDELRAESPLRIQAERRPMADGFRRELSSRSPYIELDEPTYRRIVTRSQYIRKERQLRRELGPLGFEHYSEPEDVRRCLPSFFSMHTEQWRYRADVAGSFTEEENVRFFEGLAERLSQRGWLSFSRLCAGGHVVAQDYSFLFRQTLSTYRSALDRSLARYSPGHLLLKELFHWAWKSGAYEIDMLRGEYGYKLGYATGERRALRLRTTGNHFPLAREDGIVELSSLRSSKQRAAEPY